MLLIQREKELISIFFLMALTYLVFYSPFGVSARVAQRSLFGAII